MSQTPPVAAGTVSSRWPRWLGAIIIALAVGWAAFDQVRESIAVGNAPARVIDPWSDSACLRSALAYLDLGFWHDTGLPRVMYGERYRMVEGYADPLPRRDDFVYLHYPPGPNWLTAAAMAAVGPERVWLIRCLPIALAVAALALLGAAIVREDGGVRGAFVIAALLAAPMASNMMHNLHMHSYALSLVWLEAAVCIVLFGVHKPRAGACYAALAAIGFTQGWLSFDYAFLVALTPLPLFLLSIKRHPWRRLAWTMGLAVAGFTLAHGLHFFEVVIHLGGFRETFIHFQQIATERSFAGPVRSQVNWPLYLTQNLVDEKNLFGFSLTKAALGAAVLCLLPRRRLSLRSTSATIAIQATGRARLAILAALAASAIWTLVMRSHALEHHYFVLRHFMLMYLACLIMVARGMRLRRAPSLTPTPAAAGTE